jgi:tetratricopeptide (TPR) repeat protein
MNRCAAPPEVLFLLLILLAAPSLFAQTPATCHPGVQRLARGDFAGALKNLQGLSPTGQSAAVLMNSRGVAELLNGDHQKALQTFAAVLELDGRFVEARFNRAIVLLQLQRYPQAAAELETILELDESPLVARASYHRALAAHGAGDLATAEQWLRKATTAEPDLSDAWLYLGVVLERQNRFAEAGEAYRTFLHFHPASTVALLRFGVVAHRAGFPDTARRNLRQAIQLAPNAPEAVEARKYLLMLE